MANQTVREKRRANRMRKTQTALMKAQEQAEVVSEDELDDGVEVIETDSEDVEKSLIAKDMYAEPMMGPMSWDELDVAEQAREQADHVREVTWNVQDLVSNILYSPMPADEKASAIKKVGDGFGKRLKNMDKMMEKSLDMDLLEIKALLARDVRHTPLLEFLGDWITKKKFDLTPIMDITSIYLIHDKAHVRQALHSVVKLIEKGGQDAIDAKEVLPKIKEAAKELGIGAMDKTSSAVVVEKDKSGSWRAVMWPSNNFIDSDQDIISESAHKEYVGWVNKNMDVTPVFMMHHVPGTLRKNRVDFVGYESGFLIMSAPLEEHEAAGILRTQILTDLGMSHGTFVLERNQKDKRIIEKYRMVEVSDLPLDHAANPFTDLEALKKEANMNTKEYLVSVLGSEEEADKYLSKMDLKQKSLRDAGVEEKAKKEETLVADPPAKPEVKDAPTTSIAQIVEAVKKEIDVEGLSEMLTKLSEDAEKVPVLEALIKELKADQDSALAEKISPPIEKSLAWQKKRSSQAKETVLDPKKEEDEKLKKAQPEVHWLNKVTGTEPVAPV